MSWFVAIACLALSFQATLSDHQNSIEHGSPTDDIDSAALPAEHRALGGLDLPFGGGRQRPGPGGGYGTSGPNDLGDPWPLRRPDMPNIKAINVQCEKSHMRVYMEFDRPFHGMIFSKGHYSDPNCVHLQPGSGTLQAQFDIFLNTCGMTASGNQGYGGPTPAGTYVESTIIVQYDPLVQEVWDLARRMRCTWYDYYEKAVTFKPFEVAMLDAVTANFLGDNLQCWMQIQVGKGPWASEVSGIVKIGQTMTMVLAIKDDENKFDMLVRNCVAHDGSRAPIQLVDQHGCVTRPKIMSRFQKIKNFGPSASVVSYAYFQAFKFPDSVNVYFQCVIQVCKNHCPEPTCGGAYRSGPGLPDPRTPFHDEGNEIDGPPLAPANLPPPPQGYRARRQPPRGPGGPGPLPLFPQRLNKIPPGPRNIPVYSAIKREGREDLVNLQETDEPEPVQVDSNISSEGSSPTLSRRKRHVVYKRGAVEMTDISTTKVIQVVSPGDVAFNLNTDREDAGDTVIVSSPQSDGSSICLSIPGFSAGLIMLLLVLILAVMVAVFMFLRIRTYNRKRLPSPPSYVHPHMGFDNPEFVKVPTPSSSNS